MHTIPMTFRGWSSENAIILALAGMATLATLAVLRLRACEPFFGDATPSAARNLYACAISGVAIYWMQDAVRMFLHEYAPYSHCGTGMLEAERLVQEAILLGCPCVACAWKLADPTGGRWTYLAVRWSASAFTGCCGFWILMLCL